MSVVFTITFGLLVLAGMLTLVRLVRGPRTLDRVLAVDVLVVLIACGVAVEMAQSGRAMNIALLLAITLLGFLGSIGAVRLIEGRKDQR
ncbi:monovalent cation/H+ antiporter complex subunit F [Allokutzneria sp. A3M-2-11 16]|uniref:monovalent cation/H+ antiporter complex subunit F n=1 Tax=Allokutzneria sp. A3M-2-11 16 TaxID=2962043 RepID=UPI0020B78997|nr:monovalent cation/H+ antiporter complex subunit F [Allokutzneria sp. A3M-2-11 16]MCP3804370.1 monovalent cation/H+ antiporter complex subunit F [Allokutzneria sp. A3M-2-11 16]